MIYTKLFSFGSKTLKIETLKKISPEVERDIQFLLEKLLSELNHKVANSSAEKFNSAQTNIPVYIKKEFIDFLEYNVDFYNFFLGDFDPFQVGANVQNLRSFYEKDLGSEAIIKVSDIKLDTSFLRTSYVVELLSKFLDENKIKDYRISISNIVFVKGESSWESRFDESEFFSSKVFELKNSLAILVEDLSLLPESLKFGAKPQDFIPTEVILLGKNIGLLKLHEKKLKKVKSKSEIIKLARLYKFDVAFITEDGKVEVFQGLDQ